MSEFQIPNSSPTPQAAIEEMVGASLPVEQSATVAPPVPDAEGNPFVNVKPKEEDAPGNPFTGPLRKPPGPDNFQAVADMVYAQMVAHAEREAAKPMNSSSLTTPALGKELEKMELPLEQAASMNPDGLPQDKYAEDLLDAWIAGWQLSTTGLDIRDQLPDTYLKQNATMAQQFVSGLATLTGDIPMMAAGLVSGGVIGLSGGPAAEVTVPVGAAAGASAFPAMYRRYLMDSYEQQTARDFRTFWQRTNNVLWEGIKHGTIGAATAGAGIGAQRVAGAVGSKVLPKFLAQAKVPGALATSATMARLSSEIATMTSLGSALEGHIPSAQDFVNSALFVGFLHGTSTLAQGGTHAVAGKLRKVYAETGIRPEQVVDDCQKNPQIVQDLLSDDGEMPHAYRQEAKLQNVKPPPLPEGTEVIKPTKEMMKPYEGFDEAYANPDSKLMINEGQRGSISGEKVKDPQKVDRYGKEFTPEEKSILNKVTDGPKSETPSISERVGATYDELYRLAVEEYKPIRTLEKAFTDGKPLESLDSPTSMFINQQSAGIALKFLESGVEDFTTKQRVTRGIKEVLKPWEKDIRRLEAYRISKQALDMDAQGKKTGINLDDARKVVAAGEKEFEAAHKELVDIDHAAVKYLAGSGFFSDKQVAAMFEHGDNYVPMHRLVEDKPKGWGASVKSKPIKARKGSERDIIEPMQNTMKNVIQFAVLAERMRAVDAMAKRAIEAGGPDGVEGMFHRVKSSSDKMPIGKEIAEFAEAHGIELTEESKGLFFAFRPKALNLGPLDVVRMVDGKMEIWRAGSPEVAKLLQGGDRTTTDIITKVAAPFNRALVTGATMTLEFATRNPVVDSLTAWLTEGALPVYTQLKGLQAFFQKGEVWDTYLSGGGSMKSVKEVQKFAEQYKYVKGNSYFKDSLESVFNAVKSPWDTLVFLRDLSEMSTRLGVTDKVLKELTANGSREITPNIIYEAGRRTRSSTIDFLRTGAKVRAANQAISFLSVWVQAMDVGFGAFGKDIKTMNSVLKGEQPASALKNGAFARMAPITAMTVMNWWANKDDERVRALKRWEKDHFWIFATDKWVPAEEGDQVDFMPDYLKRPGSGYNGYDINKGTLFKFKKPEVMIPFTSLPERMLEAFFTDNPRAWKDFDETMIKMLVPNLIPTIALPVLEAKTNYSNFTDHQLVPDHLMNVAPELRYHGYTSETAKKLGEATAWLGRITNSKGMAASPIVIDNYVKGWLGGMGGYLLSTLDQGLIDSGVVNRPPKAEKKFTEMIGVRAWVAKFPMVNSQHTDDFLARARDIKQNLNSLQLLAKRQGSEQKFEEFLGRMEERDMVRLDGYTKTISEAKEYLTMIDLDPDMTPKDKRQLAEGQMFFILGVSKEGLDLLDELDKEVATMKKELKGTK